MTNLEFSNEFDVLYNNVASNGAPGVTEYEKSVFLTKAEKQLLRAYFEPSLNKSIKGFDGSEKRQYDFSSLIKTVELECISPIKIILGLDVSTIDPRSILYKTPKDLFLSVNETISDDKYIYNVLPINYQEYSRNIQKPYAYPIKRQAWRMISSLWDSNNYGIGYHIMSGPSGMQSVVFRNVNTKPLYIRVTTVADFDDSQNAPIVTEADDLITIDLKPVKGNMIAYWTLYLQSVNNSNWKTSTGGTVSGSNYIRPMDGTLENGIWPSQDLIESSFSVEVPSNNQELVPLYEVIGRFNSSNPKFTMRYVKVPTPIILVDLNDIGEDLSIDGYSTVTECCLPVETHEEILQRAVELAKAAYTGDLQSQIALGVNSETNMGMIASK